MGTQDNNNVILQKRNFTIYIEVKTRITIESIYVGMKM